MKRTLDLTPEQRAARADRMRALNANPEIRRKGQGAWTPERRALKSAEMTARNFNPDFHQRKLAGIARRPPRGLAIPDHTHPVVRGLFIRMNEEHATRSDVAHRAGISTDALTGWRATNMPQIDTLDAALGALDLELAIVPRGTRNPDGFITKGKGKGVRS